MKKKVIYGILLIALVVGSFIGGNKYSEYTEKRSFNASISPADSFVDAVVADENLAAEYDKSNDILKKSYSLEQVQQELAVLKGGEITNIDTYEGSFSNQVAFEVKKDDKSYSLLVTTIDSEGVWGVGSFVLQESLASQVEAN